MSFNPSEGTPKCFKMDKVVDWKVSTDGSLESFVIPENNIKYYTKMTASYCMSLSLYTIQEIQITLPSMKDVMFESKYFEDNLMSSS